MTVRIDRFDREVFAFNPSQLPQTLAEAIDVRVRCDGEPTNARPFGLRPRRERPCSRRAAEQRDEISPPHRLLPSRATAMIPPNDRRALARRATAGWRPDSVQPPPVPEVFPDATKNFRVVLTSRFTPWEIRNVGQVTQGRSRQAPAALG